jgi:hypothetical protein
VAKDDLTNLGSAERLKRASLRSHPARGVVLFRTELDSRESGNRREVNGVIPTAPNRVKRSLVPRSHVGGLATSKTASNDTQELALRRSCHRKRSVFLPDGRGDRPHRRWPICDPSQSRRLRFRHQRSHRGNASPPAERHPRHRPAFHPCAGPRTQCQMPLLISHGWPGSVFEFYK